MDGKLGGSLTQALHLAPEFLVLGELQLVSFYQLRRLPLHLELQICQALQVLSTYCACAVWRESQAIHTSSESLGLWADL